MSHTPGPWCVDEVKALGAYGVWTDYPTHPGHDGAGYGSMICSVISDCFPLTGKNRGERTANARLIAASPRMYEFISLKAREGDSDAAEIVAAIDSK